MSMERSLSGSAILWLVAFAGCGGGAAPPGSDAGRRPDTGVTRDSGPIPDGSTGPDAHRDDDGGTAPDGGTTGEDAAVVGVACDAPFPALATEPIAGETRFEDPVFVTSPPGSSDLYVVERAGDIELVRDGAVVGTFLDVSELLDGTPSMGNEWGLLGLAFHPDYETNGRFFIGYTPNGGGWTNYVAEGHRSEANGDRADAAVTTVIEIEDDFASNHNGGMVAFGPDDYLYVGTGDGGNSCDPEDYGQDRSSLLGKILRLDVDTASPYAIPPSNPFVGEGGGVLEEIWAFGLRNPWRFSFDRVTGDLWIADVGQDAWEEVNFAPRDQAGQNYGWDAFEGVDACFRGCGGGCGGALSSGTHHTPLLQYPHGDYMPEAPFTGNSISGGYVYRGSIPGLQGAYFFADYTADWIRAIRQCDGEVTRGPERIDISGVDGPSGFGEDGNGELYITNLSNGQVLRIVEAD
jgi:glucose/arabinose dehydrogenase